MILTSPLSQDEVLAREGPARAGLSPSSAKQHPKLVLATTILASGLAFVDGSVVNIGLPAIQESLHASAGDLQWIVNAYLLPLSALLLFGGAAGDRFGRRLLLIFGIALFALSSIACAMAPNLFWLLIRANGTGNRCRNIDAE